MARYKIAWLPGDGVGKDVMDAARITLDALKLDADYPHGDIGWEFWCSEGDAFPVRTVDLNHRHALSGQVPSQTGAVRTGSFDPDQHQRPERA